MRSKGRNSENVNTEITGLVPNKVKCSTVETQFTLTMLI